MAYRQMAERISYRESAKIALTQEEWEVVAQRERRKRLRWNIRRVRLKHLVVRSSTATGFTLLALGRAGKLKFHGIGLVVTICLLVGLFGELLGEWS